MTSNSKKKKGNRSSVKVGTAAKRKYLSKIPSTANSTKKIKLEKKEGEKESPVVKEKADLKRPRSKLTKTMKKVKKEDEESDYADFLESDSFSGNSPSLDSPLAVRVAERRASRPSVKSLVLEVSSDNENSHSSPAAAPISPTKVIPLFFADFDT